LTALNERVLLLQHLAREARHRRDSLARHRFEAQARAAEVQKEQMREVLRAVTEAGDSMGDEPPAR
jgi:rRNA maturation endonuclease Nob1